MFGYFFWTEGEWVQSKPQLASIPAPTGLSPSPYWPLPPPPPPTPGVGSFFSHRTHRFNRTFLPTFRTHRTPPAYREHRGLSTNISCNALCFRL